MVRKAAVSLSLVAAVVGIAAVSLSDAGEPCKATSFKTELVKNACATDLAAAKAAMKDFVKKANDKNGTKWKCTQCHSDLSDYDLKSNALDDFKKANVAK